MSTLTQNLHVATQDLLRRIGACPHRGGSLPLSQQPYAASGCRTCGELVACTRHGRGVATPECVACMAPTVGLEPEASLVPSADPHCGHAPLPCSEIQPADSAACRGPTSSATVGPTPRG